STTAHGGVRHNGTAAPVQPQPPLQPQVTSAPTPVPTPVPTPPVTANNLPPTSTTPVQPQPTVAAPAAGTVDPKGTRATIRAHSSEVQNCYDRAHLERNDLHGKVVLTATIGPQGQVLNAGVANSTAGSARLEQCLIGAFQGWTFPQPAGGVNGNVTY